MSDNNKFQKDDRVEATMQVSRTVFGTVACPKTPYGRVEVNWDESAIEDTHMLEWDLMKVTPEEERASDLEEAQRLLDRHGLNYTITSKDEEVLARNV